MELLIFINTSPQLLGQVVHRALAKQFPLPVLTSKASDSTVGVAIDQGLLHRFLKQQRGQHAEKDAVTNHQGLFVGAVLQDILLEPANSLNKLLHRLALSHPADLFILFIEVGRCVQVDGENVLCNVAGGLLGPCQSGNKAPGQLPGGQVLARVLGLFNA